VVAYDNDNKVVVIVICTGGQTYTLNLPADRKKIKPDGKDLSFVTVEVLDKKGNLCPKQIIYYF
jgi:beta-galactosidase